MWKRIVEFLPAKEGAKDAARSEAIRRWPDKAAWFAQVKDHRPRRSCLDWMGQAAAGETAVANHERLPEIAAPPKCSTSSTAAVNRRRPSAGFLTDASLRSFSTRPSAAIGELAAEAAIVLPCASSGCPLETLRHALDGRDAGPLGAALVLVSPQATIATSARRCCGTSFSGRWSLLNALAAAARGTLANDDDVGARYHLKRTIACVKAAAATFKELEALLGEREAA